MDSSSPMTLHALLSNTLIQSQLAPYLPLTSILFLAATSAHLRDLLLSPPLFSHLDLSVAPLPTLVAFLALYPPRAAQNVDRDLAEDEIYSRPLRFILSHLGAIPVPSRATSHPSALDSPQRLSLDVLAFVRVLVLDGLTVTAELLQNMLTEERFAGLMILSVRGCSHLNERLACQALNYAVRDGREGRVPIRGLYIFGPKENWDAQQANGRAISSGGGRGVMAVQGAQIGAELRQVEGEVETAQPVSAGHAWYGSTGRALRPPDAHWADTLRACSGTIAFDAVLCRGPRHDANAGDAYLPPAVATVTLGRAGCETCGSCPEGAAVFGRSPECELPLLAPLPVRASTVRAAQRPDPVAGTAGTVDYPGLLVRCEGCLKDRWCERCNTWWCEDCYRDPVSRNSGGGDGDGGGGTAKVYMSICTEHCLRGEMLAIADGMWG